MRSQAIIADHRDELPDYESHPSCQKTILTRRNHHREAVQDPAIDSYVDALADELRDLAATRSPIFVEAETN